MAGAVNVALNSQQAGKAFACDWAMWMEGGAAFRPGY
jgi:hypothetical protein